ncbi:MAG: hypothetical protein OEZ00_02075 [Dehalococcoidia bacterium]|nr:hypothetical protein [Dehalococcoidia bacterium]
MSARITRGTGKLCKGSSEQFVAAVNYRFHEELSPEGSLDRWWGELTFVDNIRLDDGDGYTIELEDKRKGTCSIKRRINKAVILVPPRYFYLFRGKGPLE